MSRYDALLKIADRSIRLEFDNDALARRAEGRLYLWPSDGTSCVGEIVYVEDSTVAHLVTRPGATNAVVVDYMNDDPKRFALNLKVFDEFTVALARSGDRITVRYPKNAPLTYLLDDVLQAAIQPFLEEIGGFILHGACLVKHGVALALMGNSGAGKSTTAFNLIRGGFHCYADDAIIVTPHAGELLAWPFSQEMSIRPLSFQLLERHGLSFANYRREGKKYYFRQPDLAHCVGVPLRYACLIEVGGETITEMTPLTASEFLACLLKEQRYFSFMNRRQHDRYAGTVTECVPMKLAVALGKDLNAQIQMFERLLADDQPPPVAAPQPAAGGRSEKLQLIRNAWMAAGSEPLAALVPLLADSDLKIFKNALAFFQNFPLAQLEPDSALCRRYGDWLNHTGIRADSPDWLRAAEWSEGARSLVRATALAGYEQYAAGWFRSAPLLYAFLIGLVSPHSAEHGAINDAWNKYLRDTTDLQRAPLRTVMLLHGEPTIATSVTDDPSMFVVSAHRFDEWTHIITRLAPASGPVALQPVFDGTNAATDAVMTCLQALRSAGVEAVLSRWFPLCALNTSSNLLLHQPLYQSTRATTTRSQLVDAWSKLQTGSALTWNESSCVNGACALHRLGICSAGHFTLRWGAPSS